MRLLPGALGDEMSSQDESFSDDGLLGYAQYTRPAKFEGESSVRASVGDHGAVAIWRRHSTCSYARIALIFSRALSSLTKIERI